MRKPKYHFEVHWDKKQNLNVAKCIEMPMCEGLGLTENAAITDAKNAIRELSKTEAMEERVSKHRKLFG